MLGWEIFIVRRTTGNLTDVSESDRLLASWKAGLGGTTWLDHLVAAGLANNLGGNGYPNSYEASAGVLTRVLGDGVPPPIGPMVIGEDYVHRSGHIADARLHIDRLRALPEDEMLLVELWDQS